MAGEIATTPLVGSLGIESLGSTAAKNKIAVDLAPAATAGPVMEFTCGPRHWFRYKAR